MIKSMTGYGRAESVVSGRKYTVEVKSLNHRYLEIALRLPSVLSPLEIEIRKRIGGRFARGRIDANIKFESEDKNGGGVGYELNVPLVRNYYALLDRLRNELNLEERITLNMMAAFRDAFVFTEQSFDMSVIWEELKDVLDGAIAALMEMREKEGETLYKDLIVRMELIANYVDDVASRAPQVVQEYQRRLHERIREIAGGVVIDDVRLSQEIVIMAERSDITEEIIRLKSHMSQFHGLLESNDAVGRNIDFLIQEMNREINTIGSKSSDAEISRKVVDIKSELARVREQVQNIE